MVATIAGGILGMIVGARFLAILGPKWIDTNTGLGGPVVQWTLIALVIWLGMPIGAGVILKMLRFEAAELTSGVLALIVFAYVVLGWFLNGRQSDWSSPEFLFGPLTWLGPFALPILARAIAMWLHALQLDADVEDPHPDDAGI